MKLFLIGSILLTAAAANAASIMGNDAVEIFRVMAHPSVQECIRDVDVDMQNISISKEVYRCPGCTNYTISGNLRNIDTPDTEKTVITIKGRSVPGTVGGWIQTYRCQVEK